LTNPHDMYEMALTLHTALETGDPSRLGALDQSA
jgi:hypothetical protein